MTSMLTDHLFNAISEGALLIDTAGQVVQANPAIQTIFAPQPLVGRTLADLFGPEGAARVGPEPTALHPLRSPKVLRVRRTPAVEGHSLVLCSDVTQAAQDRARADENEALYREVFDHMLGGLAHHEIVLDKQGLPIDYIFVDTNSAFERITGIKRARLIGRRATEVFPTLRTAGFDWIGTLGRVAITGIPASFETYFEPIHRWLSVAAFRVRPGTFTTAFLDVTTQHMAKAALAEEKERLAVTLRSIGDGVITTDTRGNTLLLNRVAEQMSGWTQEEAQGHPLSRVFRIENEYTGEPLEDPVKRVLDSGGIMGLANHTVLVARDGSRLPIADSGAPVRDASGEVQGVVLVFRDATEERLAEACRLRTQKLESLGALAGGLAHDFNNVLTAILGNVSLARADLTPSTPAAEALGESLRAIRKARFLTQQLLTFSKGGRPSKQLSDLVPLVRSAAGFALHGSRTRLEFVCTHDQLPVECDPDQISQVIENIVLNAAHSMPAGGTLYAELSPLHLRDPQPPPLHAGDFVRVLLRDEGTGIPESLLGRIFEPYFTTKQVGSGMGLAVAYSIVQQHEGMITVSSTPGEGATFEVYLPAATQVRTPTPGPTAPASRTGRILILDDDEAIGRLASRWLERQGHQVSIFHEAEPALASWKLARAEGQPFDLAILDLTIPGGPGGADLLDQMRELDPQVRAVVASGYSNDPIMSDPTAHGFIEALQKPFTVTQLSELIARRLS